MRYLVRDGSQRPRKCGADGCETTVRNMLGFCQTHAPTAYPCRFADEGCTGRVHANSRSRCCSAHDSGTRQVFLHVD